MADALEHLVVDGNEVLEIKLGESMYRLHVLSLDINIDIVLSLY